jgi:hypothetical protein
MSVLTARARAQPSTRLDSPDRFPMLLEAVIVILKIRIGFVLGSFFGKLCVCNGLQEYGAISFFVFIALSRQPVLFAPAIRLRGSAPVRPEFF